jgi:hypothetical protein
MSVNALRLIRNTAETNSVDEEMDIEALKVPKKRVIGPGG